MAIPRTGVFSLYVSLSLLLLLLRLSVVSGFSPIDHYLIDCGATGAATLDADHRRFTGDASDLGSGLLSATRTFAIAESSPSVNLSPIYHTARVFTRPSKYAFKIRDKGTHLVRFHFRRFDSSDFEFSDSQFHVSANGFVLLNNFTGMDAQTPKIKDYMIWVDTDVLRITFTPSRKSKLAFVNAIEVISAPKDLIADVAQFVNSKKSEKINGLMKTALEAVYRVNVGGPKVTPFNDSLWRTWVPDNEFLKLSDGSKRVYSSARIKYQLGGASREAGPDNVYNTARVLSSSDYSVPNLNITWEFPVIGGYRYLVRMHFCDIASASLGMLYFNVYVNGNLAYENLDLSAVTNLMLASPFYADFVVDGESSEILTVSVGPSNKSLTHAVDAILNGVEIMKMNNTMGSLDGEVCTQSILKGWQRRNIGAVILLVAAVCLLAIASLFIHRAIRVKDSVAWSPLSMDISEDNLMKSGIQPRLVKA